MKVSRRSFVQSCTAGALTTTALSHDLQSAAPARFSQFDAQARQLLAQMTIDENIGQMTQPDKIYLRSPQDINTYNLGSVLSGGDSDPKTDNDVIPGPTCSTATNTALSTPA